MLLGAGTAQNATFNPNIRSWTKSNCTTGSAQLSGVGAFYQFCAVNLRIFSRFSNERRWHLFIAVPTRCCGSLSSPCHPCSSGASARKGQLQCLPLGLINKSLYILYIALTRHASLLLLWLLPSDCQTVKTRDEYELIKFLKI